MSSWEKVRLGDICDTISETYRSKSENVVLINTSDVLDGKVLNHTYEPNKNLKGQFKKTFQKNDILYSEIRPRNKRFAFVDFEPVDYIASTKLMVLRAKDIVIPKYLYLILSSNEIIEQLQVLAESRSGTFPQITFSELNSIEFDLPPLEEQERIAKILGSLDDKIELNNKINRNLEAQAEALFKQWFVDFDFPDPSGNPYRTSGGAMIDSPMGIIPEGWRVGKLSDIANIIMGQSPSGSSYNEDGIGAVFYQGRAEFGLRFPQRRLYTTEPKRIAPKDSILMSVRAPVGDINIAYEECCIGRGLSSLYSKTESNSFLLYTIYSLQSALNQFNGEGTVFGSINKDSLSNMSVIIPTSEIIYTLDKLAGSLDAQIKNNFLENQRLTQLRDALLPKLMNNKM